MEHWTDYYLLVGTAAATLAGLVFVAITLRPETAGALQARHIFGHFIGALILSLIALVPQDDLPRGLEIAAAATYGLWTTIARVRGLRSGGAGAGWSVAAASQALILLSGIAVAAGAVLGPYGVGLGVGLLVILSFRATWRLVAIPR